MERGCRSWNIQIVIILYYIKKADIVVEMEIINGVHNGLKLFIILAIYPQDLASSDDQIGIQGIGMHRKPRQ
jgi:hypothetical protein